MPSSPAPHPSNTPSRQRVSPVSMVLGFLALAFGCTLAALTLAGAFSGYAAIGFFDLAVGSMFLMFSWQSAKYGLDVTAGRQTVLGETVRS